MQMIGMKYIALFGSEITFENAICCYVLVALELFPNRYDYCLLITFENCLYPDQGQQNTRFDLDSIG